MSTGSGLFRWNVITCSTTRLGCVSLPHRLAGLALEISGTTPKPQVHPRCLRNISAEDHRDESYRRISHSFSSRKCVLPISSAGSIAFHPLPCYDRRRVLYMSRHALTFEAVILQGSLVVSNWLLFPNAHLRFRVR